VAAVREQQPQSSEHSAQTHINMCMQVWPQSLLVRSRGLRVRVRPRSTTTTEVSGAWCPLLSTQSSTWAKVCDVQHLLQQLLVVLLLTESDCVYAAYRAASTTTSNIQGLVACEPRLHLLVPGRLMLLWEGIQLQLSINRQAHAKP
jgi:hypothetical protein